MVKIGHKEIWRGPLEGESLRVDLFQSWEQFIPLRILGLKTTEFSGFFREGLRYVLVIA